MKPLKVYTLGNLGINRVKSPIHVQDGELLSAQNATVRPIQGQQALAKRDGMVVINSEFANGTLLSINNIPVHSIGDGIGGDGPGSVCSITTPPDDWLAGAWSPSLGLFAIVSGSGNVATSPDGMTWTARTSPAAVGWEDVFWSEEEDLFVAVGGPELAAAQQIMTSPDGITWTSRTAVADRQWEGVTYSPSLGIFCAVAQTTPAAGQVMTSPDGITWTSRTAAGSRSWRAVTWADGLSLFVAVSAVIGQTNEVMTSPDGIAWTLRDPGIAADWYSVCWSPELEILVAGGEDAIGLGKMMYSVDGINWTDAVWNDTMRPRSIAWSPELGIFVAAAFTSDRVAISDNGIDWWFVNVNCAQDGILDIVWAPELERFLLIGVTLEGDSIMELFG
jgi:hypothetical protein